MISMFYSNGLSLDNFDLHNHSTASDGLLSPTQLVELGASLGVDGLALTDHDTVDGIGEAADAARRLGLRFIPGVEISVSWGDTTLHIVGLGIDPHHEVLASGLLGIREGRLGRARRMGDALAALGHEGAFEAALGLAGSELRLSRSHFARHLVQVGAVSDTQRAFDRYLGKGKPAFVQHEWAHLNDAVGWIRAAGGVAVLAHPGRYRLGPTAHWALLAEFVEAGGTALEVATSNHSADEIRRYAELALEFGLEASRGSDFHGPAESHAELGRVAALPYALTPVWHRYC